MPPIRKRGYLPLRWLKVFRGIENHIVAGAGKEVQPTVFKLAGGLLELLKLRLRTSGIVRLGI